MPKERSLTNIEVQKDERKHLERLCSWGAKRQVGYAYYSIGITDPMVLSKMLDVAEKNIYAWLPQYEEAFQVVTQRKIRFMVGNVTNDDIKLWKKTSQSIKNIIDEINEELKIEDKIHKKILQKMETFLETEDLEPEQIKQCLSILAHYKNKDAIRAKKVDTILKLKKEFENDSGVDTEKEMRKERTKLVEKVFISEKVEEYKQERASGKGVTNQAYYAKMNEANEETKKFLDISDM